MKIFNPSTAHFHFTKKETIAIYVLFLALFVFLFFKAALMGLFHDELLTFYFYLNSGVIYPPEAHLDANNHFLNSQLSLWTFKLFGPSPLAIRLPNVLAYPFYCFAVVGIAGRFKQFIVRWSFALSLMMCSFIFEYFAMCRGYGLSMMFLFMAIYCVILLIESKHPKHLVHAAILLWLGVAANMTVMPYALLIFIFMGLHTLAVDFKKDRKRFFVKFGLIAILGPTFLIHAKWSFQMKEAGLLVHGALDGLYEITIVSVAEHTFGEAYLVPIIIAFLVFWLSVLIIIIKPFIQKSFQFMFTTEGFLIYLLVASVTLIYAMAEFLEINYPQNRTGMHLLALLISSLCAIAVLAQGKLKWLHFGSSILLFFPLQFVYYYHPADSLNFDGARHSDRIYEVVKSIEHEFKFPLTVSSRGFQQMAMCYSNYRSDKSLGSTHYTGFPQLEADIILKEDRDTVPQTDSIYMLYDSIYWDPHTHITCFKRKEFLERDLLHVEDFPNIIDTKSEYFTFLKIESDSLNGDCLFLGVEMSLSAQSEPFKSRIVLAVDRQEEPRNIYYEYIELDWMSKTYQGEQNNVVQGALIHRVPEDAESVAIYLWNTDTTTFSIRDGKCYLYRLNRDF